MGVSSNGVSPKPLVSIPHMASFWMSWGYPHFRKPPHTIHTIHKLMQYGVVILQSENQWKITMFKNSESSVSLFAGYSNDYTHVIPIKPLLLILISMTITS